MPHGEQSSFMLSQLQLVQILLAAFHRKPARDCSMQVSYEPWLVLLSIVFAIEGAYLGLHLTAQIGTAADPRRRLLLTGAAFSFGVAIWTLHFVGVLADGTPFAAGYLVFPMFLSFALGVLVVGVAVYAVSYGALSAARLIAASCLLAAAFGIVHYTGMTALHAGVRTTIAPAYLAASLLIAFAGGGLAFRLTVGRAGRPSLLIAASAFGLAITAAHYMAAAGTTLAPHPVASAAAPALSSGGDGRGKREGASRFENLAGTDLRHIVDPADIERTHELAARLARVMRARLIRRQRVRRHGHRLDLRRTIHRNVSHGGTLLDLAWRRRKEKPLRLVFLLDASGSMSLYTAFFVRFLHGVVDAFRQAEAFVFHTRLAHVSASLRDRDVTRAVDKLALMAQGIGGTRIGESLATFNKWHARRVINSRTAVMIVSDGYDTGEPERLAEEMRRSRRRCRKIIWLNPLIGWRDYSPQARGMQAALPFVDLFAPAHNLESLAALEPYLARI
jgi:uncharacterized protein with von Willebrand factor type A (vWA) domain/NO-binding membrane sensor protein with MHYT domain